MKKILLSLLVVPALVFAAGAQTTKPASKKTHEASKSTEQMITLMGVTDTNRAEVLKLAKQAGAEKATYDNGVLKTWGNFNKDSFSNALQTKMPEVSMK